MTVWRNDADTLDTNLTTLDGGPILFKGEGIFRVPLWNYSTIVVWLTVYDFTPLHWHLKLSVDRLFSQAMPVRFCLLICGLMCFLGTDILSLWFMTIVKNLWKSPPCPVTDGKLGFRQLWGNLFYSTEPKMLEYKHERKLEMIDSRRNGNRKVWQSKESDIDVTRFRGLWLSIIIRQSTVRK